MGLYPGFVSPLDLVTVLRERGPCMYRDDSSRRDPVPSVRVRDPCRRTETRHRHTVRKTEGTGTLDQRIGGEYPVLVGSLGLPLRCRLSSVFSPFFFFFSLSGSLVPPVTSALLSRGK